MFAILLTNYSVPVLSLGRLAVTVKNKQAMNDDENCKITKPRKKLTKQDR